jgi:hypothetical protein
LLPFFYRLFCSRRFHELLITGLKVKVIQYLKMEEEKKIHLWENLNRLFYRKVSFLTGPHCQFSDVDQGMKKTYLYLWYPLFQAQQNLRII